jgi:hypothetical protein
MSLIVAQAVWDWLAFPQNGTLVIFGNIELEFISQISDTSDSKMG